jgi:hypothetical protein
MEQCLLRQVNWCGPRGQPRACCAATDSERRTLAFFMGMEGSQRA